MYKNHKIPVLIFFIAYFILGIFIFQDYGLSWDDSLSRLNGEMVHRYMTGKSTELLDYSDRDFGTALELPLVIIEKLADIESPRHIYYMRHFLTFALFFLAAVFFYLLAQNRFGWQLAFLGVFFLILSPRIFADSFYNSKDIGLLSVMIIAVYTLTRFLENPNWKRALPHAAMCALAVDIRFLGLVVFGLTAIFFLFDSLLIGYLRQILFSRLKIFGLFLISFSLFVVLFWPYLWGDPIGRFFGAMSTMSLFRRGPTAVFYFGNYINVSEIPWHYALVWIVITTPLIYSGLFLAGAVLIIRRFFDGVIESYKRFRSDFIFLAWFFVPLITIIMIKPGLYNGWRHLYFIYPAFILIALIGMEQLWQIGKQHWNENLRRISRGGLVGAIIVSFIFIILFMVRSHPHQNLYFNTLTGGMTGAKMNFNLDYYGLTFREGLEYIAANNPDPEIFVLFDLGSKDNIDILPDRDRVRFISVDLWSKADYILYNYLDDHYVDGPPIGFEEFYNVEIGGEKIMTVFKNEKTN